MNQGRRYLGFQRGPDFQQDRRDRDQHANGALCLLAENSKCNPKFLGFERGKFAGDADMTGALNVPTLTLHAEDDPTAFVELENSFRELVTKAGRQDRLVQSFTDEHEHSKEATPEYAALFRAMLGWIEEGKKPSVTSLTALCETARVTYGETCHFDPGYFPKPLSTRVYDRVKPPVHDRTQR
jgi:hypothetical protein